MSKLVQILAILLIFAFIKKDLILKKFALFSPT